MWRNTDTRNGFQSASIHSSFYPNACANGSFNSCGYSNTIHYTHSSTVRTLQEIFAVTPLLGDAANATDLQDLFQTFPFLQPQ